ncbi:MAG: archaellum operon transcriptional activator EarA family protein, partial [Archaeoglobaceae archaeon]
SNLSTQNFNRYMAELIEKGFVREVFDEDGKKYYTLTDKGFKFIQKYNKIREFIEEFGL